MITMRSMYPLLLLLCVVQGYTLEMNNSSAVQTILPLLKSFIPRQAIIVPLGIWTAQDYVSLCNTDFSVSIGLHVHSLLYCFCNCFAISFKTVEKLFLSHMLGFLDYFPYFSILPPKNNQLLPIISL